MFGRTIKVAILIIVFVLFISLVFPAGTGTNFGYGKSMVIASSFEKYQGSMESLYHPILTIEELKMFFMIEDEDGNRITVDMPKDIDEIEIEDRIIQKIKEESNENGNIGENGDGMDDMSKVIPQNENLSLEESGKYVVLTNQMTEGIMDGHLFCDVNGLLSFDTSSLFSSYNLKKCEGDFDGDGIYEEVSFSPILSYKYTTIGLYDMHIRITYNYNYSYYPIYIDDVNYFVSNDFVSNSTQFTGDVSMDTNIRNTRSDTPSISGVGRLNTKKNVEIENITPKFVEYQNIVEYTIEVSVGSIETGYPPILDFELCNVVEERELRAGQDVENSGIIFSDQPFTIQIEPKIYQLNVRNPRTSSIGPHQGHIDGKRNEVIDPSIVYVRVKEIESEKISYLEDYQVEFDASKTIDINEGTIFYWDFGDGNILEGINVCYNYSHRGTYTVTLYMRGWSHSVSKTFVVLKGSENPKIVILGNYYERDMERYLFCNLNEPLTFDISEAISLTDGSWLEWDFDGDGIYEENTTSTSITRAFLEPGYFLVGIRHTYIYERLGFILWIEDSVSKYENNDQKPDLSYHAVTYWIKVVVMNKDNILPLIPDFITTAPNDFPWWNQEEFLGNYCDINEQKNVTYLKYYSSWNNRLNSWSNPVTFNANSTITPEGTTHDDFFYSWDFGDGETSIGIEASHKFEDSQKDYQVKLTVWNDNYNVSIIKMVAPRPSSPNIYLYRETPGFDTIRIIVDGRVTKAVPLVELGTDIVWEDVFIENGKLLYDGEYYNFLYYEELLNEPKTSE
ncbi:MAG: PKD domain-containing protein [Thermoplasmata archaeon]|nr:MAG: PKD domain-containing protein [Thermoplasmata archaeon]